MKMNLHYKVPTAVTVGASIVAGLLSLLNVTTFGFQAPWQTLVTVGLAALAALGISPLTGPALRNVLHISHKTSLALATLVSTVAVAITTLSIDSTVRGLLTGLLTLVAGVLFGPGGSVAPQPDPAPPAPAPVPVPPAPAPPVVKPISKAKRPRQP